MPRNSIAKNALFLIALSLVLGLAVLSLWQGPSQTPQPAEPANLAAWERGRQLYITHCASCHGANLEGQPNWTQRLPSGRLPAPPHDVSGHTWHHPDRVLFAITKYGTEAVVGGDYESDMPGFSDRLADEDIWAILDYIKSRWPERERTRQAEVSRQDRIANP